MAYRLFSLWMGFGFKKCVFLLDLVINAYAVN